MLNVGRLEVLCAVVERGSFSAAAEALSYTQSAISQSIARLEAETGVQLVIRDRRGVTPTPAGITLVAHAERIFAEVRAAEADLAEVTGARLSRLRMGSFPSGGAALMPLAVARFRRAHPDVPVTLIEGEPSEIAPRLRAGELDLALLFGFPEAPGATDPPAPGTPGAPTPGAPTPDAPDAPDAPGGRSRRGDGSRWTGLRSVSLLDDPLDLALPADHPLAHRRRVTLADLRGQPWVQTPAPGPCARHVVRCCLDAGFAPDVAFESDDYDTVQGLVAAGVGVALVPRLALSSLHAGIVVRTLSPASPVRRVVVATAAGTPVPPAARSMIQVLTQVADRRGAAGQDPSR